MKLRSKLLIAPAIAVVMLLSFGAIAFQGLYSQSAALDEIYTTRFARYQQSSEAAEQAANLHSSIYRILSWGSAQEESRSEAAVKRETARLQKLDAALDGFKAGLADGTAEKKALQSAIDHFKSYIKHSTAALDLATVDSNMAMMKMQNADEAFQTVNRHLDALVGFERNAAKERFEAAQDAQRRVIWTSAALLLAATVLSVAATLVVTGRIVRPLHEAGTIAQRIASGDLRTPIEAHGTDETAALMRSLAAMQEGLRGIAAMVGGSASQVTTAARQLAQCSLQIESACTGQSDAAQATASSVEQLSVSIASVAEHADRVNEISGTSLAHAKDGTSSVAALEGQLEGALATMQEIALAVSEFVDQTRTIDGMTRQVTDIAEQTNLLALNAAIEAARAGEQGRGFAVVADEVRLLAEKSAAAAREINTVTSSLQERSKRVRSAIDQGKAALSSSKKHMTAVSQVLGEGEEAVRQSTAGVSDITNSVKEQNTAAEGIARNIEGIARMTDQTLQQIAEASAAARTLEYLADSLNESVGHFKVG